MILKSNVDAPVLKEQLKSVTMQSPTNNAGGSAAAHPKAPTISKNDHDSEDPDDNECEDKRVVVWLAPWQIICCWEIV